MTGAHSTLTFLDCTLRDGGYYNAWDFPPELVSDYLQAMQAAQVDIVELGFRFLKNEGFKGAHAFSTDDYLCSLPIPDDLSVGVMVNGADLCTAMGCEPALEQLFPLPASESPVDLVRLACHYRELETVSPAVEWLHARGYRVGLNLMQISERSADELEALARMATSVPLEVLYFADSMGGMTPADVSEVICTLRIHWQGPIGVHTHDNLGLALSNTLCGADAGATWLDATVTGMGRGPGNARTEELAIELGERRGTAPNLVPLLNLIRQHFQPLQSHYGWGTNPYYYLAGKYGIHPTYIQEMLSDERYDNEDILAVIEHLRETGGSKFSFSTLDGARNFYQGEPTGTWRPATLMQGREVLILGSGPGVAAHRPALEAYIRRARPLVMALNTQSGVDSELIDLRIACHPVRLLADAAAHQTLPQPLITPVANLPSHLSDALDGVDVLDFGLAVQPGHFQIGATGCVCPASLVLAYALAVVSSGGAQSVLMAGFDGYAPGDGRNDETAQILDAFDRHVGGERLVAITPTRHRLRSVSVYGSVQPG